MLERGSKIWWLYIWALHKTVLIIFQLLQEIESVHICANVIGSVLSVCSTLCEQQKHRQMGGSSVLFRKYIWPGPGLIRCSVIQGCVSKLKFSFLHSTKSKYKVESELGSFKISPLFICNSLSLLFANFKYAHVPGAYHRWVSSLTFMNGAGI